MPRQPRLDAPGSLHHVMGRGIDGIKIFSNRKDREDFLKRLADLFGMGLGWGRAKLNHLNGYIKLKNRA